LNGDSISCEEILIRLISRKKDILPDGGAATEAFILRQADTGKLSVFRKAISDIQICKSALSKPCGATTLHTGRIRSAIYPGERQLDIIEAEGEGTDIPGHSALIGLPDPLTEYGEAERVASILREQSRSIPIA
jgi:hypothetical protein